MEADNIGRENKSLCDFGNGWDNLLLGISIAWNKNKNRDLMAGKPKCLIGRFVNSLIKYFTHFVIQWDTENIDRFSVIDISFSDSSFNFGRNSWWVKAVLNSVITN